MLVFGVSAVSAAEDIDANHNHRALPIDNTLTLAATLDATLERFPSTVEMAARADEADAWADRGRSWLADSPSLSFRYQSDRWGDDNRLEEFESGIELPLWRWGERGATQLLGQSLTTESLTASDALRWEVAGLLRGALWDIALTTDNLELAETALVIKNRLTASVERRYELGDVALTDVMLAQSTQLEAQNAVIEAQAARLDAERAYRSLTQLEHRPPFQTEVKSAHQTIESTHPALAFADAVLRRAEAKRTVAEKTAKGNPTLLIGPRRERAAFGAEFDESIGISISVPFGGGVHTHAETTAAGREVATARAALDRERRYLDLQMHEAAHSLDVVAQSLVAANERAELANRHYGIGESAYEKGELDLIDLLKLQSVTLAANRDVVQLENTRNRQIALYNQAVGELP